MVDETELAEEQEVDFADDTEEVTESDAEDTQEEAEEAEEPESDELEDDSDDIEYAEVEINGKTYQVPVDLRDGYMQQADYTRKTQALAEQRKQFESKLTDVEEMSQAEIQAQAEKVAVDAALERFKDVDWNLLERQNPNEANRLFRQYQQLKERSQGVDSKIAEAAQKREAETQQVYAERFEQSMQELGKAIPNWGEEKAQSLKSFAEKEFGFTEEEFRMALHDPRQIKMVNMAFAASKATKSPKPKSSAPKLRPASKVKGGTTTPKTGLSDRLSAEEWIKRRNAQASKKRR